MNCDTCNDNYIKVNSFCYEIKIKVSSIGFDIYGITTFFGQLYDNKIGK